MNPRSDGVFFFLTDLRNECGDSTGHGAAAPVLSVSERSHNHEFESRNGHKSDTDGRFSTSADIRTIRNFRNVEIVRIVIQKRSEFHFPFFSPSVFLLQWLQLQLRNNSRMKKKPC